MGAFSETFEQAVCDTHGEFQRKGIKLTDKTIWLSCPQCVKIADEKKAQEDAQKAAKDTQERYERALRVAGIPHRFEAKSFDSFVADTDAKERALSVSMEFASNFKQHHKVGSTMVFSGKPGTGKSHLAIAILREVMKSGSGLYTSAIDAVRMVRDTWRKNSEKSETEVLRVLASVDLLVLDEVGVQYGTEAEQVTLFDIIDKRYRDMMPMILLTNMGTKGMREFLGDRSYDRLREAGLWVPFDWESHRSHGKA